ncbi:MAG: PA4642 family protein [Gammaproteobacteria bacterium]|nr:PA4642 family protein [Gammaproteobacteria bacterium]
MSLKKDKQKVFGGEWTEESMRFFLESESYDGTDVDFINLIKAYQHMTAETFAEFVAFFKEEGHNVSAKNLEGESALAVIASHAPGKPYAEALKAAGAE